THAPAPREAAHRIHPLFGSETQTGEQLFCSRPRCPGIRLDQSLFQLGDSLALLGIHLLTLGLQCAQMVIAVDHEFPRRSVAFGDFLLYADDSPRRGDFQCPCVRIQTPLKQSKQGRLSCSVLSYNSDPFTGVDDEVGAIQQYFGATTQYDSRSTYHDSSCSLLSRRI